MKTALFALLPLAVLVQGQSNPMTVEGCSGTDFTGTCHSFTCPYEGCCELPAFFQESLVSVRSTGAYGFRLFTTEGCKYHCNDNDNGSRQVDDSGWGNIGADAYKCIDGPY